MIGQSELEQVLAQADPISLDEIVGQDAALLNRIDTKYVLGLSQLETTLEQILAQYRVLSIDQRRISHYQTLYFDTGDFTIYQHHHNGMRSRYKIRARKYVDSDLAFLEVKHKTKNRTIKSRVAIPDVDTDVLMQANEFVDSHTPFDAGELEPKLWNDYLRVTLVSKQRPERLTLDFNVEFGWEQAYSALDGVVIAEVKQAEFSHQSEFIQQMRRQGLRPMSFSKYTAGVYHLYSHVKSNNFKPQILQVNKVIERERQHDPLH